MVGERMLTTMLRIIREEFPETVQVRLAVASFNEPAKRLYSRFGFSQHMTMKKALCIAGEFRDKDLMVLELDKQD